VSELDIPESWAEARILEITERLSRGKSPKYDDKGRAFTLNQRCIYWDGIKIENVRPVSDEWFDEIENDARVRQGDVLVNSTGTGTLGRVACFNIDGENRFIPDSHVTLIRFRKPIYPIFFSYFFRSSVGQESINAAVTGSTNQIELNRSRFSETKLPIPPLGEQKRIVAKIESCFSKIDAIEKSVDTAETLLKKYRESLLAKAFRGELVPQDPKDEPASKLLERIRTERDKSSDGKKRKKDELPPIDPDEIPFEIPKSWEWVRLGELDTATGNTPKDNGQFDHDFPFFKPADFSYDGPISIGKSNDLTAENYNSRTVDAGTVMLVCIGATLGKSGVVTKKGAYNQQINSISTEPHILPEYLCLWLRTRSFQHNLWKGVSSTTLPIVNKSDMGNLLFPLAPFAQQKLIVETIRDRLSKMESVLDYFTLARKSVVQHRSAILNQAFSGRLVPQDPAEGTGHNLLRSLTKSTESEPTDEAPKPRKKRAKV
jgi:type I restriction enzyme S subunit